MKFQLDQVLVMPDEEIAALLEYSCSLPTGTTIGKQWVMYAGKHDFSRSWPPPRRAAAYPRYLGEYVAHVDPDKDRHPVVATAHRDRAAGAGRRGLLVGALMSDYEPDFIARATALRKHHARLEEVVRNEEGLEPHELAAAEITAHLMAAAIAAREAGLPRARLSRARLSVALEIVMADVYV